MTQPSIRQQSIFVVVERDTTVDPFEIYLVGSVGHKLVEPFLQGSNLDRMKEWTNVEHYDLLPSKIFPEQGQVPNRIQRWLKLYSEDAQQKPRAKRKLKKIEKAVTNLFDGHNMDEIGVLFDIPIVTIRL